MISGLQNEVSALNKKVAPLEKQADDQEQYSRRNCLLLHGIDEDQDDLQMSKLLTSLKINWKLKSAQVILTEATGLVKNPLERRDLS